MRPLDFLLSVPEQRLLGAVLSRPDRDFGTVELLDLIGSSRSAGSALLKRWVDAGFLLERRVGNQRRLTVNQDFVLYPELQLIVRKTIGITEPLARALAPVADRLTDAFVFGSVAAGTDTSDSDIDVGIVGNVDLFTVSPLLDATQGELGRPVHVSVYGDTEWRRAKDPVIAAIKNGPRLNLMDSIRGQTH